MFETTNDREGQTMDQDDQRDYAEEEFNRASRNAEEQAEADAQTEDPTVELWSWVQVMGGSSKAVEQSLRYVVAPGEFDYDSIARDYRAAINDVLPERVTFTGDSFYGPASLKAHGDFNPVTAIRTEIEEIDFWQIVETHRKDEDEMVSAQQILLATMATMMIDTMNRVLPISTVHYAVEEVRRSCGALIRTAHTVITHDAGQPESHISRPEAVTAWIKLVLEGPPK